MKKCVDGIELFDGVTAFESLFQLLEGALELREVMRSRAFGEFGDHFASQERPHLVNVFDVGVVQADDQGTLVGHDLDEPVAFQPPQGFTQRRAAYAELIFQIGLDQLLARLKVTAHDSGSDCIDCTVDDPETG
jgi:hypothetical protein